MRISRICSVLLVSLVSTVALAQAHRVNESVRLRNWKVPQVHAILAISTLQFVTVSPCRIVDTRLPDGPYGGPTITSGGTRSFDLNDGPCSGLPANVAAYSLNLTVANPTGQGNLTAWPTGIPKPGVSNLNYRTGVNLANAAIVAAGTGGSIDINVLTETDVVVDVNGYFVASGGTSVVRVTPNSLGVWEAWNDLCGLVTLDFTNGETPNAPLGTGSFQVTGTDGNGGALATSAFDGLLVSQLSTLRYSTRSEDVTDHPYIYINIDDDNDTIRDRTIYFFPANNSDQGPSTANVWQTWNGLTGKWNIDSDTGPLLAVPISTFAGSHILGVRIASGCGGTTGGVPRARNTDDVEIGVDGNGPTVYDFERN